MTDVKAWIFDWLQKNSSITEIEFSENLDSNYFEKGWLDSLRFINFIGDIEDHFQIQFSNDQFQDRSFSSVNGVANVVTQKLNSPS